jgi:hypothetical protein
MFQVQNKPKITSALLRDVKALAVLPCPNHLKSIRRLGNTLSIMVGEKGEVWM